METLACVGVFAAAAVAGAIVMALVEGLEVVVTEVLKCFGL